MDLGDLVNRKSPPTAWEEGDNIPWNEAGFSRRMLNEHLSQAHDAASRRVEIIDRQVDWIHTQLLGSRPSRILDLGCGPGLYSERLARLGHSCTGIDFSPASIEYATETARKAGLTCQYTCQDIRQADYPGQVDLVMLIYGEFNVFRPGDARLILEKAHRALKPEGLLLLEPHTYRMVQQIGRQLPRWYSSAGGLFLDAPHLVLQEHFWEKTHHTASIRYFIVNAGNGEVIRYAQSYQAYTQKQYRSLLKAEGFPVVEFFPGLSPADLQDGLFAIVARN